MKFSIAFALLPLLGSAYARPTTADSIAQRDGYEADKGHHGDGKDYDRSKDKHHYPDNLSEYPNKHCDVRYQNFLDLLLDDVCAKFYQGDRKHEDRKPADDKKHRRDGKDHGRDDWKKNDHKGDDGRDGHKEVKECDDRADKLLEEACRTYYHYDGGKKEEHKDDGKDWDHKEDDKHRDDGKKEDDRYHKDDGKKDDGKKDDGKKDDDKKDDDRRY